MWFPFSGLVFADLSKETLGLQPLKLKELLSKGLYNLTQLHGVKRQKTLTF
jgi:hypothetical protein